jgi:hypothetical protein
MDKRYTDRTAVCGASRNIDKIYRTGLNRNTVSGLKHRRNGPSKHRGDASGVRKETWHVCISNTGVENLPVFFSYELNVVA